MIEKSAKTYIRDEDMTLGISHSQIVFFSFKAGAKFAQNKILEMASEGYDEYKEGIIHYPLWLNVWQTATIASEKKHLKENCDTGIEWIRLDNKIADLQKERAEMKEALIEIDQSMEFYVGKKYVGPHVKLIEKLKGEK